MNAKSPLMTLNTGVQMPLLGLGVLQAAPAETAEAVNEALNIGYRLIDTAAAYQNEAEVGEGIARSGVDRAEVFVTTKLWIGEYGHDQALRGFDRSLRKLGLDYLDLYLLHWPVPSNFEATIESFKVAAQLLEDKRVRAIGVCNHNPDHLSELIERTGITPAVNQIELHPYFSQRDVVDANKRLGIVTQAWSPIGGVKRYRGSGGVEADPLSNDVIQELAERHGKSPAQIILRWHIEKGVSVIPKSVKPNRLRENIDVFHFALTSAEVALIDKLDVGGRGGPDPEIVEPGMYNITIGD